MTPRQQVTKFAQSHGLSVNGKGGIPMLSNKSLSWIECFDNWKEAMEYLTKARIAHIDTLKPYPWN